MLHYRLTVQMSSAVMSQCAGQPIKNKRRLGYTIRYRRFHGDVIRRVTWASGTTGWQKTFGWRAPRVFLLGFMPCLH